jgi:SAM-dependent methyltransferase
MVAQGNVLNLPFRDCYFDYVVTGDVLGHVPEQGKDRLLHEMWRVLRVHWRTIHSAIETHGTDPLSRICVRYPDLYEKCFVVPHGHVGYEYPSEVIQRFERVGFRLVAKRKLQGIIWPTVIVIERLDNEYRHRSMFIDLLVRMCRVVYSWHSLVKRKTGVGGGVARIFELATGLIGRPLDAVTSFQRAGVIGVVFEKPARQPHA